MDFDDDEVLLPNYDDDAPDSKRQQSLLRAVEGLYRLTEDQLSTIPALLLAIEFLTGDEVGVLQQVASRLALGASTYGPLEIESDRNLEQEALEECLDGTVYLSWRLLQLANGRRDK